MTAMTAEDDLDRPFLPNWASPPGDHIQEHLDLHHCSHLTLSIALQLPWDAYEDFLAGALRISETMAEMLGFLFGPNPVFWLALDRNYVADMARLGRPLPERRGQGL